MNFFKNQNFIPLSKITKDDYTRTIDTNEYNELYKFTTTKEFLSHILHHTVPEFDRYSSRTIAREFIIGDNKDSLCAELLQDHISVEEVLNKDAIGFSFACENPETKGLMHINISIILKPILRDDIDRYLNYFDWLNYSEYDIQEGFFETGSLKGSSVKFKYDQHISLIFCMDSVESEPNSVILSKVVIESSDNLINGQLSYYDFCMDLKDYTKIYSVGYEYHDNYNRIFPFLRTIFNKDLDYDYKKEFLERVYLVDWNDYYTEGLSYLSY